MDISSLQSSKLGVAALGLRGVIDSQGGILGQMTAKQANATLRYALEQSCYAWHGRYSRTRFTDRIHRQPFNYPFGQRSPLVDSGRLRRQFTAKPSIKTTATRRSKVQSKISISTPPYANFRPKGRDLSSKKIVRSKNTINQYLRLIPVDEQQYIVDVFTQALTGILKGAATKTKTYATGKKAGQTTSRTALTARQAQRIMR